MNKMDCIWEMIAFKDFIKMKSIAWVYLFSGWLTLQNIIVVQYQW